MKTDNTNDIVLYETKNQCCACGACVNICPKQAIKFIPDEDGFLFPQIDQNKCVKCGKCLEVCLYKHQQQRGSNKETYVAVAQGIDISNSASGGIFASIAKYVIENEGIVFGCTMVYENGQFVPRHIGIECVNEICKLQGSKYVQSSTEMTFQSVKDHLDTGRTVLYSGTPCQIAALTLFLGKYYESLFTIDTICHGVPSAQFFNEYIKFESEKRKCQITDFTFRDKSQGWKLFGKMVLGNAGIIRTRYFEPEESSYYQMFLNGYTYRENCYTCQFACENRPGDITIGDYWCIDLVHPELLSENGGQLDQKNGVSCLIVNSQQGRKLIDEYGSDIQKWPSTYENASRYNKQLLQPTKIPDERAIVFAKNKSGYKAVDKWYRARLRPIKLRRAIVRMVPKGVKKVVKRLIK